MAVEVPQNKRDFWKREEWRKKAFGFAIRRRRANRGRINIKEREQGGVV